MAAGNAAVVERFEDSWTRRDLAGVLACADAAIVFDWSESRGPFVGRYEGHEGLTQFWMEMLDAWEHFSPRMTEVIECGPEQLITLDVVRARGRGSGIDMEARGAMLWTVKGGKIARAKMFQTKDEALAACSAEPKS